MRELTRRLSRMPILHSVFSFEEISDYFRWGRSAYASGSLVTALFLCRSLSGDDFNYITDRIAPDTMSGFKDGEEFEVCEIVVRLTSVVAAGDGSWRLGGYRKVTLLPEFLQLSDAVIIIEDAAPDSPAIREMLIVDEEKSIITITPLFRITT